MNLTTHFKWIDGQEFVEKSLNSICNKELGKEQTWEKEAGYPLLFTVSTAPLC